MLLDLFCKFLKLDIVDYQNFKLDGIIPSNEELAMAKVISALRRANVSKNESSQKLPESARPFNLNSDVVL